MCIRDSFRTDHKLFISIHVAFLYDERKKSILIQHAYTVLLGRIQIFFFCVLYSTADKQRRLGGKDDIKNLQMILLDHSFTPIKSGMESVSYTHLVIGPVRFDEEKANSVQQEKTDKKKSAEVAEMVKSAAASTPETDLILSLIHI